MILLLLSISEKAHSEVINKVLAYVGNNAITLYDVQGLNPKEYSRMIAIEDEAERSATLAEFEKQALEFLISQEVIVLSAEREGIIVAEEEIDAAIAEVAARSNVSVDELEALVEKEGLSLPMYRSQIKTEILNARVRMQVLAPKTVVSEDDIRMHIEQNPEEYDLYDKYDVRMLMASTEDSLDDALDAVEGGLSFDEAVKQYSTDASATNGGKLGFIEPALLSDNMREALEGTKVGAITEPFEVNGQWAVFMVDDFQNKFDISDELRAELAEEIAEDLFTKVFAQWLEKNSETIVIMRSGEMF